MTVCSDPELEKPDRFWAVQAGQCVSLVGGRLFLFGMSLRCLIVSCSLHWGPAGLHKCTVIAVLCTPGMNRWCAHCASSPISPTSMHSSMVSVGRVDVHNECTV
mmetsp:Transcript_86551/g.150688  ORF Transcript_86551/g.150688 Transcript_86551/m.150688 type:complete len:104 (-) Transcript_86551:829-1140(-)